MDYVIVVPSYNRPVGIKSKTLALLDFHKIPHSRIYVFVANEEQRVEYLESIGDSYNIIVGEKGLPQIRNFIFNYFPAGTKIVSFDDDVSKLVKLVGKSLVDFTENELLELIYKAFEECEKSGAKLWGVYPVSNNAFFMKNTISYDFKFVVGSFWGCINPASEIKISIGSGEKEDYLRTILFWIRDRKIVRFNYVAHKTVIYKGTGGLQSDGKAARIEREKETVNKLLEMYPTYIRINSRRKSPYPELSLIKQKKSELSIVK
jgi:hypothetical protein